MAQASIGKPRPTSRLDWKQTNKWCCTYIHGNACTLQSAVVSSIHKHHTYFTCFAHHDAVCCNEISEEFEMKGSKLVFRRWHYYSQLIGGNVYPSATKSSGKSLYHVEDVMKNEQQTCICFTSCVHHLGAKSTCKRTKISEDRFLGKKSTNDVRLVVHDENNANICKMIMGLSERTQSRAMSARSSCKIWKYMYSLWIYWCMYTRELRRCLWQRVPTLQSSSRRIGRVATEWRMFCDIHLKVSANRSFRFRDSNTSQSQVRPDAKQLVWQLTSERNNECNVPVLPGYVCTRRKSECPTKTPKALHQFFGQTGKTRKFC